MLNIAKEFPKMAVALRFEDVCIMMITFLIARTQKALYIGPWAVCTADLKSRVRC